MGVVLFASQCSLYLKLEFFHFRLQARHVRHRGWAMFFIQDQRYTTSSEMNIILPRRREIESGDSLKNSGVDGGGDEMDAGQNTRASFRLGHVTTRYVKRLAGL